MWLLIQKLFPWRQRILIRVNRDTMKDALKSLNIGTKILPRRSNTMGDSLLATEDATKSLSVIIVKTKSVRFQTEYMDVCCLPILLSIQYTGTSWPDALPCRYSMFEGGSCLSRSGRRWLIVTDTAVNSTSFWVVADYVPNYQMEFSPFAVS